MTETTDRQPVSPEKDHEESGESMRNLADILAALDRTAQGSDVSVGNILDEFGTRAYAPLILVPALILVTPVSGIPGLPTIGATIIFLICIQRLVGRSGIWIPDWLRRRKISREKFCKAIDWLKKPAAWMDRRAQQRMRWMVRRPVRMLTLLVICAICIIIPFLELLPLVTSLFAISISLFALGLLVRDGLLVLIGHLWIGVALGTIWYLVS